MNDFLIPTSVTITVSLLLYFLNSASKRAMHALADGQYEIRMNRMYQVVGIIGILASIFVLFIPILAEEYSAQIFITTGLCFLLDLLQRRASSIFEG